MALKFKYRNHRDEVAERTVTVDSIEFLREGNPDYKYPPNCWVLSGWDHDKGARRSFLLDNIIVPDGLKSYGIPLLSQRAAQLEAQKEVHNEQE